jgi:hypothetical protein
VTRTDRSGGRPDYMPEPVREGPAKQRQRIMDRKERFEELNKLAHACGDAWLISVPGDFEVMVEALPDSTMPDRLRRLDYQLRDEGDGQRILAHAITETILAEDGKKPIRKVTHAGITTVQRFSFDL